MGCAVVMWAATDSMSVAAASVWAATTSNPNSDRKRQRQRQRTDAGKEDMDIRQGTKTRNKDGGRRQRSKTDN